MGERLVLQPSAHGHLSDATWLGDGRVAVEPAIRRVAPGQTVVLYRGDEVAGAGLAI